MDVAVRLKGSSEWDILLDIGRIYVKRTLIHLEYIDVCRQDVTYRKDEVAQLDVESDRVESSF